MTQIAQTDEEISAALAEIRSRPRLPLQQSNHFRQIVEWVRQRDRGGYGRSWRLDQWRDMRLFLCGCGCKTLLRRFGSMSNGSYFPAGCSACNMCDQGCDCPCCAGCNARNPAMCGNCDNCLSCCSCTSCVECDTRVRSRCRRCSQCSDCCNCARNRVCFIENPVKFHAPNRMQLKVNSSPRFVAAEIEVATCASDQGVTAAINKWSASIVSDGSIPGGFEINTAPAGGDMFVRQITEICAALESSKAQVTDACGLHVHIDARDLDYNAIRRLVRLYAKIEPTLFQMVPPRRRASTYCVPCGDYYEAHLGPLTNYKDTRKKISRMVYHKNSGGTSKKEKYNESRYKALNIHSWFYRGTVECRLFVGTTNRNKILSWGMLWALIVDKAAKSSEKELSTFLAFETGYDVLQKICAGNSAVQAFVKDRLLEWGDKVTKDLVNGVADGTAVHETEIATRAKKVAEQMPDVAEIERNANASDRSATERRNRDRDQRRARAAEMRALTPIQRFAFDREECPCERCCGIHQAEFDRTRNAAQASRR